MKRGTHQLMTNCNWTQNIENNKIKIKYAEIAQ